VKIFCFYSQSHNPLAEKWLASSRVDPDLAPRLIPIGAHGNGDYNDGEHWRDAIRVCLTLLLTTLDCSYDEIIGVTGADVVFLRPFVEDVTALMANHDILMQQERPDADLLNPDVAFYRTTPAVRAAVECYLARLPEWDGHLPDQNRLMREAFAGLRVGLLPPRYANTSLGPCDDMVLFHANCLPPPDSVAKKLEALEEILQPAISP
jgi:hypothetical protein